MINVDNLYEKLPQAFDSLHKSVGDVKQVVYIWNFRINIACLIEKSIFIKHPERSWRMKNEGFI